MKASSIRLRKYFGTKIVIITFLFCFFTMNSHGEMIIDGETANFTLTDVTVTNAEGWDIIGGDEFDILPEEAAGTLSEKLSKLVFKVVNEQISVVDQFDMTTTVTYDVNQSSLNFFVEEDVDGLNQLMNFNADIVGTNSISGTFEYEYVTTINNDYFGRRCNGRFEAQIDWGDCNGCRIDSSTNTDASTNTDSSGSGGGCFISFIDR